MASKNCSDSEMSSENESESSEASVNSFIFDYDESVEPLATEEEALEYQKQAAREKEEENVAERRMAGQIDIKTWCTCSSCSLKNVVKGQECSCCQEEQRCVDMMEELDEPVDCITLHPGFNSVCLDKWVLETAAVRLKTKKNKTYTTQLSQGHTTMARFYRSVAYRQFVRFVWGFTGSKKRLPLPCCVYNSIREKFPNTPDENYQGFDLDDDLPVF